MTHECYISYEGTLLTLENYWDKCLFSSSYAANHHEFIHLIVEYVHERLQREESSVRKKRRKWQLIAEAFFLLLAKSRSCTNSCKERPYKEPQWQE